MTSERNKVNKGEEFLTMCVLLISYILQFSEYFKDWDAKKGGLR